MSLDIWLKCEHCDQSVDSYNYTYNVGPMWRVIFPDDKYMVLIDGLTGEDSLPILEKAVTELEANAEKFNALNPENGWGSREGFIKFLRQLIESAKEHPKLKWKAWR